MTVPTDFRTVFARVRRELSRENKALVLGADYRIFETELRHGAKIKFVSLSDFEKLARKLGCMADVEVRASDWADAQ